MSKLGALHITHHTGARHTATLIFLHGSGSTGVDMKEWIKLLGKNFSFPHIKILFPTARLQPYTPAGGVMSNVWFDRIDVSPRAPEVVESVNEMELELVNIIKNEHVAGIQNSRIIVGGFSMGGAMALHVGYRWVRDLAGVFAFSSFLNENSAVYRDLQNFPGLQTPPLLQIHGDSDELVEPRWSQETFDALISLGVKGEYHLLDCLGHAVNRRGLSLIKTWTERVLPEDY